MSGQGWRGALQGMYDPADIAEAAAYEAHRELDLPRRHRLELNEEIASERRAITYIEGRFEGEHTCKSCSAVALQTCPSCDEWVCDDDLIDDLCADCLGITGR